MINKLKCWLFGHKVWTEYPHWLNNGSHWFKKCPRCGENLAN